MAVGNPHFVGSWPVYVDKLKIVIRNILWNRNALGDITIIIIIVIIVIVSVIVIVVVVIIVS